MKKMSLKNLSNDKMLTRDELKQIAGGNTGTNAACATTCECPQGYKRKDNKGDGKTYSIEITCLESCVAVKNAWVRCTDEDSNIIAECNVVGLYVCEEIPFYT